MNESIIIDNNKLIIEPYSNKHSLYHCILNNILPDYQNDFNNRKSLADDFKTFVNEFLLKNNPNYDTMIKNLKKTCLLFDTNYNTDTKNNYNLIVETNILDSKIIIDNISVKLFHYRDNLNEHSNLFFIFDNIVFMNHLLFVLSKNNIIIRHPHYKIESIHEFFDSLKKSIFNSMSIKCLSKIIKVDIIVINNNYKLLTKDYATDTKNPFMILVWDDFIFKSFGYVNNDNIIEQLFNNKSNVNTFIKKLSYYEDDQDTDTEDDQDTDTEDDQDTDTEDDQDTEIIYRDIPDIFKSMSLKDLRNELKDNSIILETKKEAVIKVYKKLFQ